MKVTWILFGGPCAGSYDAESPWPPPDRIRAVHDGNGYQAVLDLPDDQVLLAEEVVDYEISSWGYSCSRGRSAPRGAHAVYFRAGLAAPARLRAARVAASGLTAVHWKGAPNVPEQFEGWAILELMGHRRLAGYVQEVELAGAAFLRLDVPGTMTGNARDDEADATQFYAPGAVYCLTPCAEELARQIAANARPRPVHEFDLARPALPTGTLFSREDLIDTATAVATRVAAHFDAELGDIELDDLAGPPLNETLLRAGADPVT